MDNVEESQENQVNAMLVEVDRNIEQLRVRSKEVEEVAQKQIENAIEWERTNIATDTKYSALCHRALNELAGMYHPYRSLFSHHSQSQYTNSIQSNL